MLEWYGSQVSASCANAALILRYFFENCTPFVSFDTNRFDLYTNSLNMFISRDNWEIYGVEVWFVRVGMCSGRINDLSHKRGVGSMIPGTTRSHWYHKSGRNWSKIVELGGQLVEHWSKMEDRGRILLEIDHNGSNMVGPMNHRLMGYVREAPLLDEIISKCFLGRAPFPHFYRLLDQPLHTFYKPLVP